MRVNLLGRPFPILTVVLETLPYHEVGMQSDESITDLELDVEDWRELA